MADSPLYIVRDNLLGVDVSSPHERGPAGRVATEQTIAAGRRGEAVATPGGVDRFTVVRAPAAPTPAPTYTALQAEAALCLYEAMLDARLESTLPAVADAFDAGGSPTMRQHALALAPFALAVYDALKPDNLPGGPYGYDSEVIPAILAAVHWRGSGYILPDVTEATDGVRRALLAGAY